MKGGYLVLKLLHRHIIQHMMYKRIVCVFGAFCFPGAGNGILLAALRTSHEPEVFLFHQGFIVFKNLVVVLAGDLVGMRGVYAIDPGFNNRKSIQNAYQHNTSDQGRVLMACANAHAQGGRYPNGSCRGNAVDAGAAHEYNPGAYKTNSGYNAAGDAVGRSITTDLNGKHREQGRTETDQHQRAQSGRFVVVFPFGTDYAADENGYQKFHYDFNCVHGWFYVFG